MSDETNRAVQAPTHAATAMIYGTDAIGMEIQASRQERGPENISLTLCQIGAAERPQQHIKHSTAVMEEGQCSNQFIPLESSSSTRLHYFRFSIISMDIKLNKIQWSMPTSRGTKTSQLLSKPHFSTHYAAIWPSGCR